ncbi:hypothetical protein [Bacillus cereus]|uniref:hypothetical protein n=1 Tax=Bacillus cereus TaxID=1396 RepID=UPI001152C6C0|nr:hypothetical protein [Bacillus cereus]
MQHQDLNQKKGINKMEHKKENLTKTIHYVIGKLFFSIFTIARHGATTQEKTGTYAVRQKMY